MPYTANGDVKIYYEDVGAPEKPAIIMNHGFGNSVHNWHALGYVTLLAPYFRLVMYDGRGFGESDKPYDTDHYKMELLAGDIIAVLDACKIEQCHFFGNSRGGNLGFLMAAMHPERFQSFIIGGAEPYGSGDAFSIPALLQKGLKEGPESFVAGLEVALGRPFPASMRDQYKANDLRALIFAWQSLFPDSANKFQQLQVPAMLFVGEQDPFAADMIKFANSMPQCEFHLFKGFDHAQAYWNAESVCPFIISFLHQQKAT